MRIVDRIILTIFTLLVAGLSLGVIVLSLRLISFDQMWTSLNHIYGQWELGLIGAILLMASLRLLFAGIRSSRLKTTIIHHAEMGEICISLDAVKNLAEKTAKQIRGVHGVKVSVIYEDENLKIRIRATISPDSNIPSVAEEVQQRVRDYIKNTVGIEPSEVGVLVENIANDVKGRSRVE